MADKLTADEAALLLGYTRDHVYRLCRRGIIQAEKFNRSWMVPKEEVDRIRSLQSEKGYLPPGFLSP